MSAYLTIVELKYRIPDVEGGVPQSNRAVEQAELAAIQVEEDVLHACAARRHALVLAAVFGTRTSYAAAAKFTSCLVTPLGYAPFMFLAGRTSQVLSVLLNNWCAMLPASV